MPWPWVLRYSPTAPRALCQRPALQLRYVEDRGARQLHQRPAASAGGRADALPIGRTPARPQPDPLPAGDAGRRARPAGQSRLRLAAARRPCPPRARPLAPPPPPRPSCPPARSESARRLPARAGGCRHLAAGDRRAGRRPAVERGLAGPADGYRRRGTGQCLGMRPDPAEQPGIAGCADGRAGGCGNPRGDRQQPAAGGTARPAPVQVGQASTPAC